MVVYVNSDVTVATIPVVQSSSEEEAFIPPPCMTPAITNDMLLAVGSPILRPYTDDRAGNDQVFIVNFTKFNG